MNHAYFMQRAIRLALKGKGRTSPNPMVGALLVRRGKILAEGYHSRAGKDHAEVAVLKKMKGRNLRGATLYVTMEPCCHNDKKTPPCVPVILASGVRRIVIGTRDSNPKVNGRGLQALKKRGIYVVEGVLRNACRVLNLPFEKWIRTGLPYVTLKAAISLDGKIAAADGSSRWISNAASRAEAHRLRGEADAILVGSGTLKKDDPLLTSRQRNGRTNRRQPAVVVVGRIPHSFSARRLFSVKGRPVLWATAETVSPTRKRKLLRLGTEVLEVPSESSHTIDLKKLLYTLGRRGIVHLLVEGGSGIHSSFVAKKLADRLILFIAPKLLGGSGLDWLSDLAVPALKKAPELRDVSVRTLKNNLQLESTFESPDERRLGG